MGVSKSLGLTPKAPSTGRVSKDVAGTYAGLYSTMAEYAPKYAALGMDITEQNAPRAMSILRGYNPAQTSLLDQVNTRLGGRLAGHGALDPALRRGLQQNMRGSQAARGLGWGIGDAAMEDFYLTQTQEERRRADEAAAAGLVGLNENIYGNPLAFMSRYSAQMPDINQLWGLQYGAAQGRSNAEASADSGLFGGALQLAGKALPFIF